MSAMTQDEAKARVAQAALAHLPASGTVGLGSGSTAKLFIDGVGALVAEGRQLVGVPTSDASRRQAEALGIPLLPDEGPWSIDVCVDGADEVSDALDLIKGGGGCHTREKIVNQSSRKNIIVVDSSKLSTLLGERWAVPVEVLPFGRKSTALRLQGLKPEAGVSLRQRDGKPFVTDAGNFIYDVALGALRDPASWQQQLLQIPGVVETGLFLKRVDLVLVADRSGVTTLERQN